MGTRSYIAIQNKNGTVKSIYCHWDGYQSQNGRILLENYTKVTKVRKLLALGSISSLGPEIGEKTDFNNPREGQCIAYKRDRGDTVGVRADNYKTIDEFLEGEISFIEYIYIFDVVKKAWLFSDNYETISFRLLTPEDIKKQ